jgi:two-component system KDP operon response regulator KdpE
MPKTIVVIENDPVYRHSLYRLLQTTYHVILLQPDKTIIEEIAAYQPNLVILDQLDLCQTLRTRWPHLALIVLSVEARSRVIAEALDLGADDYIVKPFSSREVDARVRALLRRTSDLRQPQRGQEPDQLQSKDGYLSLNKPHHLAYAGGRRVYLTPVEFALVWKLLLHQGKVMTSRTLLQTVWGPEYKSDHYVRVYIRQIRRKIETDPSKPRYILTEPGIGYTLRVLFSEE